MAECRPVKPSEQLAASSRYELILRLARGGMGSVFLGIDRDDSTQLRAIKRAHPHLLGDPSFRKMFVREARLALQIDAVNAIGVLDVDDSDGELVMVMRYVEGPPLTSLLDLTKYEGVDLRRRAVLRVIVDAARGLDVAHKLRDEADRPLGIVHRDVSPHNILVSISGVASIVDFGVAKAMSEVEATHTATNVIKGKFAFMAPEYLRNRIAGPRSDVFSLGVVAWEALAAAPLFRTDNDADTAAKLLSSEEAPSLDEVIVGLAPEIADVLARALRKKPEERFATAGDFADALEAAAESAASLAEVGELAAMVRRVFGAELAARREMFATALRAREEAKAVEATLPMQSVLRMSQRPPPVDIAAQLDQPVSHAKTTMRISSGLLEAGRQSPSVAPPPSESPPALPVPASLQHPPEPTREARPASPTPRGLAMAVGALAAACVVAVAFLALRRSGDDPANVSTGAPPKVSADALAEPVATATTAPTASSAPTPSAAPVESAATAPSSAPAESSAPAGTAAAAGSTATPASASAAPNASSPKAASSAAPPAPAAPPRKPAPPRPKPNASPKFNPQEI